MRRRLRRPARQADCNGHRLKTVGSIAGRCPHPGPPSEMGIGTSHLLARTGKALPRNLRGVMQPMAVATADDLADL